MGTGHAAARGDASAGRFRRHAGGLLWRHAAGDTGDTIAESFAAHEPHGMALRRLPAAGCRRLWPGAADAGWLSRPHCRIQGRERDRSAPSISAMPAAMRPMRRVSSAGRRRSKNNNAQNEYYLTDVPALAQGRRRRNAPSRSPTKSRCMGVNSRAELAAAEAAMQAPLRARALDAGVGMTAPETVFLSLRHGARSRCRRSSPLSCSVPA